MQDIVAGSIGGAAQALSGHPLDTLKVRLQTQRTQKYTGIVQGFQTIFREEGLRGFYKGVQSPLTGLTFNNAIVFFAYGQSKTLLSKPSDPAGQLSVSRAFGAGALVGTCASVVESPIDLFKSQLQVQYSGSVTSKYSGFVDCAKRITKEYGVRGVYQGYQASILKMVPSYSAYFGTYEATRRAFSSVTGTPVSQLPSWQVLTAGGLAGIMCWLTIYPLDVIKSRLQADSPERSLRQYRGFGDCARQIYAASGYRGFFVGLAPCLLRAFPANAVCFLVYEATIKMLPR